MADKPNFIFREDIENIFTDIVKVEVDGESVFMELGIKNKQSPNVILTHRIVMTMPHFMRFASMCENAANQIRDNIEKQTKKKE
ncbi:MAG: hypothetical protein R6U78_14040 [Bacteroidales bacterium]